MLAPLLLAVGCCPTAAASAPAACIATPGMVLSPAALVVGGGVATAVAAAVEVGVVGGTGGGVAQCVKGLQHSKRKKQSARLTCSNEPTEKHSGQDAATCAQR